MQLMFLIYALLRKLIVGPFYVLIIFLATRSTRWRFSSRFPKIVCMTSYGVVYLDPTHLVIWFLVRTNNELQKAKQNGFESEVIEATKKALGRYGYPKWALPEVHVGLESKENIKASGGYLEYFS
jgi:hypothetical protein